MKLADKNDRYSLFMTHDGRSVPLIHPPETGEASEVQGILGPLFQQVALLDDARGRVALDANLTDQGRKAKLRPLSADVHARLTEAEATLAAFAERCERVTQSAYEPPRLEPGDAVGALYDGERRAHLQKLSAGDRVALLNRDPGMLLAAVRSPTPLDQETATAASEIWRAHVEKTSPHAATASRMNAALEWATGQFGSLQRAVGPISKEDL